MRIKTAHKKEAKKPSNSINNAFENGVHYYLRDNEEAQTVLNASKKWHENRASQVVPLPELVIDFIEPNTKKYYKDFIAALKERKSPIFEGDAKQTELVFRGKPMEIMYRWLRENYPHKDTTPKETIVHTGLDSILRAIEAAAIEANNKPKAPVNVVTATSEAVEKHTKKIKPSKEERWLLRMQNALGDEPSQKQEEVPCSSGSVIGNLLSKLWGPVGETSSLQEMGANLSALHKCASVLHQPAATQSVKQPRKEQNNDQANDIKIKKTPNFLMKSRVVSQNLPANEAAIRCYFLPSWQEQSQEKGLALSKCKPEARHALYQRYLSEVISTINVPIHVAIRPSADGCFYNIELRNHGAPVSQSIWNKMTDSAVEILAVSLEATTLGREPAHIFRSNGYASFQVPVPVGTRSKEINLILDEIRQKQCGPGK